MITRVLFLGLLFTPALALAAPTSQSNQVSGSNARQSSGSAARSQSQKSSSTQLSAKSFLEDAARANLEERKLGELAERQGGSQEIKQLGEQIASDHTKNNEELQQVAQQKNISLPTELDAQGKGAVARLQGLHGAAFDQAFVDQMVKGHQKNISRYESASRSLNDQEVKQYAQNSLPKLRQHLSHAENLSAVGSSRSDERVNDSEGAAGDESDMEAETEDESES